MALACPTCDDPSLVHALPAFWRGLSQDSELKADLAPPPVPDLQWIPAAVLLALGVAFLMSGGVLIGLVALLVAGGTGFVANMRHEEAKTAMAAWEQSMYCRRCPSRFARGAGFTK
jgi:hypothetical protein